MGQQQLLLLVLAAIVVGVAVVVGINMFGESADEASRDALVQDCLTIGARAQEWYRKPTILGGGGGTFSGVDLVTDLKWNSSENGTFTLSGTASQLTITGTSNDSQRQVQVVVNRNSVVSIDREYSTGT